MTTSFLLAWLAYLVPSFMLGFVWHLKLFGSTYQELRIYRPDILVPFGFLSMLLQGAAFALVYPRLFPSPGELGSGLAFAAGAGVLAWTYTTLAVAAKHPMSSVPRFVGIETVFTLVQFLLVGLLLPLVFRR